MDSNNIFALRRDRVNKTVQLVSICKPQEPKVDRVIVKVAYAGICGTDLTIMEGDLDLPEDMILGHEISGTVIQVGDKVSTLKCGQRVVIAPQVACGQCGFCQRGDVMYCEDGALESAIGWSQDGGWRQYWELPARQVVALTDDVPLIMGVLCEPFCCVYQGWERNGIQPQDAKVLIIGAGVIGLLWASLFHLRGYDNITITEPNENRRILANDLKLGYRVCDPKIVVDAMEETDTECNGFQLIIDCSGAAKAIQQAITWLRRGGTLNLFGIPPSSDEISIKPSYIMVRSITIVGTLINPQSLPKALPTFITLVRRGYLDFKKLGIQDYPFKHYQSAINDLRTGKVTKAVLAIAED